MKTKIVALTTIVCLLVGVIMPMAIAEDVTEISWLIGNAVTVNEDNFVRRAFEEKLGIRVNATFVSSADLKTKLNTLIAANALPDLFSASLADAEQFKEEGMIIGLSDLLEQYGPNIMANVGDFIGTAPLNVDGEIYGIVRAGTSYYQNFLMRADWLKNLNLEKPTDFESLYSVLHAFTFKDPDQNGVDDTFGFVFSMNNLKQLTTFFGAYHIAVDNYYELPDGTVTTYMKAPGYLDVVKFLNRLYHEGILNPDFLTIPNMGCHEYLWTSRVGTYGFQSTGPVQNWYPGRYAIEVPQDPADMFTNVLIKGPDGLCGVPKQYPDTLNYHVISSTCKNPEAVIKFINYLFTSEGDELSYLGIHGEMWDWANNEHTAIVRLGDNVDDAIHRANGAYGYWIENAIPNNIEYRLLRKLTKDTQEEAKSNSFDYPYIMKALDAEQEYGGILIEITKEALAQLITTTGDIDAEYAEFVTRWNKAGGLELEKEATEAFTVHQN